MDMAGPAGIAIGAASCVLVVVAFLFVRRHEQSLTEAALRARDAGELEDLAA
jgi:hypothetical protein